MAGILAVRGAVGVDENSAAAILAATRELLQAMLRENGLSPQDVVSAIFTMTHDLDAVFPAEAARQLGWTDVPLLCACEIAVPGSLPRVVRVLLHVETDRPRAEIRHVYLGRAAALRPDLG